MVHALGPPSFGFGMKGAVSMNTPEITVEEMNAFAKVAAHFPPSLLYDIAEEALDMEEPLASQLIEICFDIERSNNGALSFLRHIANLPV